LTIIAVITFITLISAVLVELKLSATAVIILCSSFIIGLSIVIYQLWVVKTFMEQIRDRGTPPATDPDAEYAHSVPELQHENNYAYTKPADESSPSPCPSPPGYRQPIAQGYPQVPPYPGRVDAQKGINA
jgi:hypothetical protein